MILRKKIVFLLAVAFSALVLPLYVATRWFVLDSFEKLEEDNARGGLNRALAAFEGSKESLRTILLDWALWDDACAYMEGRQPGFVEQHVSDKAMINLKLNLILMVDQGGKIVFGKAIDCFSGESLPLPTGIEEYLAPASPLLHDVPVERPFCGLARFPEGLMLLAAHPILLRNALGPPRGTMIFGRSLDRQYILDLRDKTRMQFCIRELDELPQLSVALTPLMSRGNATSFTIARPDDEVLVGRAPLNDLLGRPAAQIQIQLSRKVFQQGASLFYYFVLVTLAAGLAFCLILAIALRRVVRSRLKHFNQELHRISNSGDPTARITMAGHDELVQIAEAVNTMLDSLMITDEALRQREEWMRLSLEGSRVGLWDWDIPTGAVFTIHHWADVLGYTPGEIDDNIEALQPLIHPEDVPGVVQDVDNHVAGATPLFSHEFRMRAKSGEWRWLHVRGKVIRRDESGQPLRLVGMFLDVTDRRRAQEELVRVNDSLEARVSARTLDLARANASLTREVAERLRAEEALQEASRRKDEFLAMLAHELRNPLAPIRNAVHVLHMAGDDERMKLRQWETIERQVTHMARLLDDLLDVSRITQGKIRLIPDTLDLRRIIESALDSVQSQIQEHGHTLLYRRPSAPIWVSGDPTRLEQVLMNLLHNAIKYTEGRGTIQVSAGRESALDPADSTAVIRVRDTGIGIAPDVLPHIFGLFVQADRTLDRTQGGLGIGLTLVDRLVQMHGGSVEAFSEGLGLGSEFVVRLPLLAGLMAEVDEPVADDQLPLAFDSRATPREDAPRRILVVDDNADMACSTGELLELWGYQVRVAYDGSSAIEVAAAFEPEIILLDIGLPGMNGYEVARCLRQSPGFADTLLVALTGYSQEEDRQEATAAGFDSFCTKPVDLVELRRILEQANVDEKV